MRVPCLLVSAVLCAALVGACGSGDSGPAGDAKMGGSITIAQIATPDSLDPALAYSLEAAQAHWLIYPGLVTYKHEEGAEGSKLIPAAAQKLPDVSTDGKTYRFQLRKGLRYSDGTPVKASDFEHAIQRSLTLGWGGSSFFELIDGVTQYEKGKQKGSDITGITADDKSGRITIRLTARDSQLDYILAFPSAGLVPGSTSFKNLSKDPPPGLGAYEFDNASIEPNRQYALVKNKRFKLPGIPPGNVDRINVKVMKSQARQAQDVIDGRLDDMSDAPPADLLPEIRAKYKDRYKETPFNSTYFMFLNTRVAPFDKLKVRQAVNYGFDKRAAQRLFSGLLEPSCNFLPPGMVGYEKPDPCPWGDPNEAPNVVKARQLVKDAGAVGSRVTVWGTDAERSKRITRYYADVLNKIGLKAKVRIIDATNYYATIGNKKYKAQTGFDNWLQDFPHPSDYFFLLEGGSIQPTNNPNHSMVDDPKVNQLAAEIKAADPSKVADKSKQLDSYISGPDKAYVLAYGDVKEPSFLSERMDFENCDVFSPVYQDDWSQFCLK
ncbi:MAG TPA: ABC transporter substrate-binding protein [Thermoleophilaceae bacterium]